MGGGLGGGWVGGVRGEWGGWWVGSGVGWGGLWCGSGRDGWCYLLFVIMFIFFWLFVFCYRCICFFSVLCIPFTPKAALIDMDGVLYDSMKNHVEAWYRTLTPMGFKCSKDEFYLYEGRTGASTIKYLFDKHFGKQVSDDECAEIYKIKEKHFNALEKIVPMPGADLMLQRIIGNGIRPVLVTGSGQGFLLDRLDHDYPGVFEQQYKVTAYDVKIGKPSPEPYLMGLSKAGVKANEAIVIENAPLGVVSGTAAQIFTIAVNTGPIPAQALIEAGADMIFPSMPDFANHVDELIHTLKITR